MTQEGQGECQLRDQKPGERDAFCHRQHQQALLDASGSSRLGGAGSAGGAGVD